MASLTKTQEEKTFDALKVAFAYSNTMQSPMLEKVIVALGVGSTKDKNKITTIVDRLTKITGQKPVQCGAKKSIASFKVREGDVIGYKITLRGERMYQFLDKLIHASLPRTKDFRGIDRGAVDEMGNCTIGIKEHIIFPETADEELRDVFGLSITLVTSAKTKEEALAFLTHIGVPFKRVE